MQSRVAASGASNSEPPQGGAAARTAPREPQIAGSDPTNRKSTVLIIYSLLLESIQIVTGPSFTSPTRMSAPNSPVGTSRPVSWATRAAKRS